MIFTILIPPATAVHISPGSINDSSVTTGSSVTFSDINLTIRGEERIPITELNFSIHNNLNDNVVAYVTFSVDGTETSEDPTGKFTVENTTTIQSDWYGYGYGYGYDQPDGPGFYFGYGYGYGYSESGYSDITFLYDIVYTTHTTGTFYWKFSVNSTSNEESTIYSNSSTSTFTVSSSSGGGGGGGSPVTPTGPTADAGGPYTGIINQSLVFDGSESTDDGSITNYTWNFDDGTTGYGVNPTHKYSVFGEYTITLTVTDDDGNTDSDTSTAMITNRTIDVSDQTKQLLEQTLNITLNESFYAEDTNDDGVLDRFVDPNNILHLVRFFDRNQNQSILISVHENLDNLFIWDPVNDLVISPVTHSIGTVSSIETNDTENTLTVTLSVEKANWTYFEIDDDYPNLSLISIRTNDGREIPSNHFWRENNTIYVLDDPDVIYHIIYTRPLLEISANLTTDTIQTGEKLEAIIKLTNMGTTEQINTELSIALYEDSQLIWKTIESKTIQTQSTFNKTIPTENLAAGSYTFKVTADYGIDQVAIASTSFTVSTEALPWIWITIILAVFILIGLIYYLVKTGYITLER